MSANDGIYIIKMDDGYRVSHAHNIETIYHSNRKTVSEYISYVFGNCRPFKTKLGAMEEAFRIHKKHDYTEYGICFVELSGNMSDFSYEANT